MRLGINGFGPCGQAVLFAALADPSVTVAAINDTSFSTEYMAHLIVKEAPAGLYGSCRNNAVDDGSVVQMIDEGNICIRGHGKISVTHTHDCRVLKWGEHDVDVVIECSAVNTTCERCGPHLQSGAPAVIIADQSIDAPVMVPGLTGLQTDACSMDNSGYDRQRGSCSSGGGTRPIVCAGTEVEAVLTHVMHLLMKTLDAQDISYTAIHGPRLFNSTITANSSGSTTIHAVSRSDWRQARYMAHAHEAIAPSSLSSRGATTLTQALPPLLRRLRSCTAYQVPIHDCTAVVEVRLGTSHAVSQEEIRSAISGAAQTDMYRDWIEVRADSGCCISRDCLNNSRMLFDVMSSSSSSDGQRHTLVFWVDLSCSYVHRILAIAKYVTSSHNIAALTHSTVTCK